MKKYCKNCKYRGSLLFNLFGWEWCESNHLNIINQTNKYTNDKPTLTKRSAYKSEFNSLGECPYYKRIWYKFWIKNK
jgi:hypothetical protein